MDAAQPAKLRTARDRPPYFAGRVRELALLNERLDDLCATGDPSAGMTLILGVPGVGKTQLAREFAEQAVQCRAATDVRWLPMHPTTLESADANVFMALMKAVGGEDEGRKVADLAAERSGVGGGGVGFTASVTIDRPRDTGTLGRLLADSRTEGVWDGKALVLTVDELQSVAPAGIEDAARPASRRAWLSDPARRHRAATHAAGVGQSTRRSRHFPAGAKNPVDIARRP